jgi:hypothetical protein
MTPHLRPRYFVPLLCVAVGCLVPSTGQAHDGALDDEGALDRLRSNWMRLRTPSVRLYVEPGQRPGAGRLQDLEAAVQRMARRLDLDRRARASLMRRPIEYVLTGDTGLISELSGIDAEGVAFADERLILATTLPHEHEIVHVLMPLALGTRRTGNNSFLQEGLASALGGHGGEAPSAVAVTADRVFARQRVDLRRMFTENGFHESPLTAHERYAVAARFVDYLWRERGGWARLRRVLGYLAGDSEEIRRRPPDATVVQLEGVYDTHWPQLEEDFLGWVRSNPATSSMREEAPARTADATARDHRHHLAFWDDGDTWVLEIRALWGTLSTEVAWGEALQLEGWAASPREPRRYVLDVDRSGARLRDLRTRELLMRWVAPRDRDDVLRDVARLRLDPAVVGNVLPEGWAVWSRPTFPPR